MKNNFCFEISKLIFEFWAFLGTLSGPRATPSGGHIKSTKTSKILELDEEREFEFTPLDLELLFKSFPSTKARWQLNSIRDSVPRSSYESNEVGSL